MRLMEIEMEIDMSRTTGIGEVELKEICSLTEEEVLIAGPCVAVLGGMIQHHSDLIPDKIQEYLLLNLEGLEALSLKLINAYGENKKASE